MAIELELGKRMPARGPASLPTEQGGAYLDPDTIREHLRCLADKGRERDTIRLYAAKLEGFYTYLPPDKRITRRSLAAWRDALLAEGYSPGTVNTSISAVNGLLDHMGRRDLQLADRLEVSQEPQPALSRAEYLRLLQAARRLNRERTYLLIKVFALTGLRIGELTGVTAEAAAAGRLPPDGVLLPDCLRRELLAYARRQGIPSGPLFVTRSGRPMRRTQVTGEIQALCRDARVEESRASPRGLRRLYQRTWAEMEETVRQLAEQSYQRMLETEQLSAGWEADAALGPAR